MKILCASKIGFFPPSVLSVCLIKDNTSSHKPCLAYPPARAVYNAAAEKAKPRIFIYSARASNLNICCKTGWHLQLNHLGVQLHDCVVSADRNQDSCRVKFPRWASRWGVRQRERDCDESGIKINGQKPILCSSALSSPLPTKASAHSFPCPPSPPYIHTLTSSGFGTFSAATGTEDGVRLVGDSGRFLCFCLGLSLSFRLCKRNQRVLEG